MMGGGEKRPEASDSPLEERLLLPPLPESAVVARSADENRGGGGRTSRKWEKTYLDVLVVCCSAEVALVERLLAPLDGVRAVSVVIPSRTVVVEHDPAAVSQSHIVKALNKAELDVCSGISSRWPSPYIVSSGVLLLTSFCRWIPPRCSGWPWRRPAPALRRCFCGFAAASRLTLDINILMLIAVAGAVALNDYMEASAGMSSLMSMIPPKVVVVETGEVVNVRDVGVGTVIAVRAGEVVPIDGVVVDRQSDVDERSLTGESFPVPKQPQSEVWTGTLNLDSNKLPFQVHSQTSESLKHLKILKCNNVHVVLCHVAGYIAVRTTTLAENSTMAKMERLVEEPQNSRSKTQRLIDSCAKYYTPAVVVLVAGVALLPLLLGEHDLCSLQARFLN